MKLRHALLPIAIGLMAGAAEARPREEQLDVPVQVTDAYGKQIRQTVKVLVFSDDANPVPAPVLVLNHGRAGAPQDRAALGRARYAEATQFFVQRGFIVAIPTRIGYGATGGEDVEDTGACNNKHYLPAYLAAAHQTLAVLDAVRRRPDAAKDRAVVMGQSFGGATALAVAALNPPGVQAAINFAGGGGGNATGRPRQPCSPAALERMFRGYGQATRIPTLWIYSENDMYFGAKYPRDWLEAYTGAGGKAKFVQFPPQGEDGHLLFNRYPHLWQPAVAEFLDENGFRAVQKGR